MLHILKPEEYIETTFEELENNSNTPYAEGNIFVKYKKENMMKGPCTLIAYTDNISAEDTRPFLEYVIAVNEKALQEGDTLEYLNTWGCDAPTGTCCISVREEN